MPRLMFLYGPSGAGKTVIGRSLAEGLNLPFRDIDSLIESAAGMAIPDIFTRETETGFRAREKSVLNSVLREDREAVVSLGGGALLDPENRAQVEAAGEVLLLTAPLETLAARLEGGQGSIRPLLSRDMRAGLGSLLVERKTHYASFNNRLETGDLDPEAAVWQAQVKFGSYHVQGMGLGYDVRVRGGSLDEIGSAFRQRELGGPVAVVSDLNVMGFYGARVRKSLEHAGYRVYDVSFPPGESQKNIGTTEQVWSAFLKGEMERTGTILALGGGVVGDLAGFSAATYMRGVPWVGVPTSLLAMVDASLGGKTGVDLPEGKNLVGAFHPPRLVWADPETLATLPPEELRSGLAEVVKHGVIGDPALFNLCAQGWDALEEDWEAVVRRAMGVKIRTIQEDPYERGLRAALNLGHTVGHALEHASGFALRHGEAVAIGMVAEARLAARLGIAGPGLPDQIAVTLQSLGLPVEAPPGLDGETVLQAMEHDKKKTRGVVKFALPRRVGEVQVGVPVENLRQALEEGR